MTEKQKATIHKEAQRIERTAQRLYDMRDSTPAEDIKTWKRLNKEAMLLSVLGAKLMKTTK